MAKAPSKKVALKSTRSVAKKNAVKSETKGTVWTFPEHTLEEAIAVAKAIDEKNGGNPMPADLLARALGFNQPDWRFSKLKRSATLYGLVSGTGLGPTELTDLGQDVVAPASPERRTEALYKAFLNVSDFKNVQDHYGSKKIPEDEFFVNTLVRQFSIPKERTQAFSDVFKSNRDFLAAFAPKGFRSNSRKGADADDQTKYEDLDETEQKSQRTRKFLSTCFVMMPFGGWFDRYYKEIFVPAIQAAGYEPRRADELFSSGSVVEQIWEEMRKADVLLADLTNKNANVFYELGLAHAAGKPVVLTAGDIDDVPFDLRHLRVIVYEVREPNWAHRLQNSITEYLGASRKEPAKSIPHPFRRTESAAELENVLEQSEG